MDLSRATYPALLVSLRSFCECLALTGTQDSLQPTQAANVLNDRVKRVGLINSQIADWLQASAYQLSTH